MDGFLQSVDLVVVVVRWLWGAKAIRNSMNLMAFFSSVSFVFIYIIVVCICHKRGKEITLKPISVCKVIVDAPKYLWG